MESTAAFTAGYAAIAPNTTNAPAPRAERVSANSPNPS